MIKIFESFVCLSKQNRKSELELEPCCYQSILNNWVISEYRYGCYYIIEVIVRVWFFFLFSLEFVVVVVVVSGGFNMQ